MNLEKIKELVKTLNNNDYKNVFAALVVFEKMDYLQELETIYNKFMESKTIPGLLNEELNDFIEREM